METFLKWSPEVHKIYMRQLRGRLLDLPNAGKYKGPIFVTFEKSSISSFNNYNKITHTQNLFEIRIFIRQYKKFE